MKRKPARLAAKLEAEPQARPGCPLAHRHDRPAPSGPQFLFPEPPPLEVLYAALDKIAEEWGIKL